MSEEIRDHNGSLIGRFVDSGSKTELYDSHGSLLGIYDSATNETHDSSGSLIGRGNQLMRLL
jgi:hypothetical protein